MTAILGTRTVTINGQTVTVTVYKTNYQPIPETAGMPASPRNEALSRASAEAFSFFLEG